MRKRMLIPTLAATLSVLVGACEDADDVAGAAEDVAVEPDDPSHHFDVEPDTSQPVILAEIESPTGSMFQFVEVRVGDKAGMLVLEQGEEGTLVMDRILELAGEDVHPSDLYAALLDPTNAEAEIPATLLDLSIPSVSPRPIGWAFEGLKGAPIATAASQGAASQSHAACNDSQFTASIPGGFLPTVFKRLNTGPSFHPSRWPKYYYDLGIQRYRYIAQAINHIAWRGTVCGKAGYHPGVCTPGWGCAPDFPRVFYQHRNGGSWTTDLWVPVGNVTKVYGAWIYNGELGPIDWRIMIDQAYNFDEFDVMMTWL